MKRVTIIHGMNKLIEKCIKISSVFFDEAFSFYSLQKQEFRFSFRIE